MTLIYSYTRAEALADGVLVDASALARDCGFRFPVALTSAAWADCVAVPLDVCGQDETGRLWDVLNCLAFAARQGKQADTVWFSVVVRTSDTHHETVKLKAVCGPGDEGEPVVTVMLPGED